MTAARASFLSAAALLAARDLRLALRRAGDSLLPLGFFLVITTLFPLSLDPSSFTGVRRRIVPARRSVKISSRYISAGSRRISGRSFCAAMSIQLDSLDELHCSPRRASASTKGRSASRISSLRSRAGCTHLSRCPSRPCGAPE